MLVLGGFKKLALSGGGVFGDFGENEEDKILADPTWSYTMQPPTDPITFMVSRVEAILDAFPTTIYERRRKFGKPGGFELLA